jgi:Zn-finger nucleic acid-binding protein
MLASEAILDEMLAMLDSAADPLDRRTLADWPITDELSTRRCPACPERMRVATMERVAVERCAAHGVWFDRGELERVLTPEVSAQSFANDYDLRQGIADSLEIGSLGMLVRLVYRKIRRGH